MDKKGKFLLGETVKIVLAILVIVGLIILGVQLYGLFKANSDFQRAKALLNQLDAQIEAMEDGVQDKILVQGIKGWNIMAWTKEDRIKPIQCKGESCLCVCKGETVDECNDRGICKPLSFENILVGQLGEGRGNFMFLGNSEFPYQSPKGIASLIGMSTDILLNLAVYKNVEANEIASDYNVFYPYPSILSQLVHLNVRGGGVETVPVIDAYFLKIDDASRYSNYNRIGTVVYTGTAFKEGAENLLTQQNNCFYIGHIEVENAQKFYENDLSSRRKKELAEQYGITDGSSVVANYDIYGGLERAYNKYAFPLPNENIIILKKEESGSITDFSRVGRIDTVLKRFSEEEENDMGKINRLLVIYNKAISGGGKIKSEFYLDYYLGPCTYEFD